MKNIQETYMQEPTLNHNIAKARVFELDVLRFLAAITVVFYHLTYRHSPVDGEYIFDTIDDFTRYGFLGVNLFFLISGFVILWTAICRSPSQFAITRFSRLYPIFWVAIAITLTAKWLILGHVDTIPNVLLNMTMLPGYSGREFEYIDSVYWTLAVELKFYFLLFVLIIFKQIDNVENWLVAWTTGCVLAPYVPGLAAVTLFPYGPYFIAGSTMFLIWRDKLTLKRLVIITACLGLSIYEIDGMVKGWLFEPTAFDPIVSSIIVFVLYLLMLAVSLGHVNIGERTILFKLAMMTYPLYLLHNVIGKAIFDSLQANKYVSLGLAYTLIFTLSYIAVYIDRYLNKFSNNILSNTYQRIINRFV